VLGEKTFNPWHGSDERVGEFGEWRMTDNHKERDAMPNNGLQFIGYIPYALVVGERDPTAFSDRLQPLGVSSMRRKVVGMTFNDEPLQAEYLSESQAKIAVREIDQT
jgi:hypothetical protein